MLENPVYEGRATLENAPTIIKNVPQLEQIDGIMISERMREMAEELGEEE